MTRKAILISLQWAARSLSLIPLLAVLFITFEDAPHHYPWSGGLRPFLWTIPLYVAVVLLLAAWRHEKLGILSLPCFIGVYIAIILAMGRYANGLFFCCLPGILYLALGFLKRVPDPTVGAAV